MPVSRGLVIALVLGFGLFNQFLFTALGAATAAEGREAEAEIFVLVANSLAGVLAIACIGFVVTTVPRRISDWTIVLAAVSAGVVIHWHGALSTATRTGWGWFIVNGALALWLVRGWFRRGWRRRQLRRAAKT